MDIALIEHAEHYVDCEQCSGDEEWLVRERFLKDPGRPLKAAVNRDWHPEAAHLFLDCRRRLAERGARSEIERDRRCDKEILVID